MCSHTIISFPKVKNAEYIQTPTDWHPFWGALAKVLRLRTTWTSNEYNASILFGLISYRHRLINTGPQTREISDKKLYFLNIHLSTEVITIYQELLSLEGDDFNAIERQYKTMGGIEVLFPTVTLSFKRTK